MVKKTSKKKWKKKVNIEKVSVSKKEKTGRYKELHTNTNAWASSYR